ncbi:MAG: transcriptional regulator [Magnetococcales bacterium]|nr:transcriptional regulator [Magnetococcales bacterium]
MKTLTIGILSYKEQKERLFAIAMGEIKPKPDDPKIWFTSREALNHVLSNKNMELIEAISKHKPASIRELAKLAHRQESNVARDIKKLEKYKIIELAKSGRTKKPMFPYSEIVTKHIFPDHAHA